MYTRTAPVTLICAVISLLMIFGCQKEMSFDTPPDNIITTNDSIYLSRLLFINVDTATPNQQDTIGYEDYLYDGLKRVKRVTVYERINNVVTYYYYSEYHYQGSDSLPYMSNFSMNPAITGMPDNDTSWYNYNNAGKIIKDSTSNNGRVQVNEYIPVTDGYNLIYREYYPNTTLIVSDTSFMKQFHTNGHISREELFYSATNPPAVNIYTYDNYLNPFKRMNLSNYPIQAYQENYHPLTDNNNFLLNTYDGNGQRFEYVYGGNSMPAVMKIYDVAYPAIPPEIFIFTYTAL